MENDSQCSDLNDLWSRLDTGDEGNGLKSDIITQLSNHTLTDVISFVKEHYRDSKETSLRKLLSVLQRTNTSSAWICTENLSELVDIVDICFDFGRVPEFRNREDIGYSIDDFRGISTKSELALSIQLFIVSSLSLDQENIENSDTALKSLDKVIIKSMLLALENGDESYLWTSEKGVKLAHEILAKIYDIIKSKCLEELLCSQTLTQSEGHFKLVLSNLLPKLTKARWKCNPSACKVFSSCVLHIRFPNTSLYIDQLLPPSLLFVDDHEVVNKVLGVTCLRHILQTTSASELLWYNRIDVIFNALQHLLYTRDENLLGILLPCTLAAIKVYGFRSSPNPAGFRSSPAAERETKLDDIFQRLLTDMQLENNLAPRRIYTKFLPDFIDKLGIRVVGHFKKLFKIIPAFLELSDGKYEASRINMLVILQCVIKNAWPRIPARCEEILQMLLALVYEVSADKGVWAEGVKQNLLDECYNVVRLMHAACPERMGILIEQLGGVQTVPGCDQVIQQWREKLMK